MTCVSSSFLFKLFFPAEINPSSPTDSIKYLYQISLGIPEKIGLGTGSFWNLMKNIYGYLMQILEYHQYTVDTLYYIFFSSILTV